MMSRREQFVYGVSHNGENVALMCCSKEERVQLGRFVMENYEKLSKGWMGFP